MALLAVVALLSFGVRALNNLRIPVSGAGAGKGAEQDWIVSDPDSLYHMRRLDRALVEGLPIAARDPLLDYRPPPGEHEETSGRARGAPVPWPPYYTLALHSVLSPFAPEDEGLRRRYVEHWVATLPAIFAALTTAVVAAAAFRLGGRRAALFAGLYHAFVFGSLKYSYLGNGDHHAFASLLYACWLAVAANGLERRSLVDGGRSFFLGTVCGVIAGLSIGSWVAASLYVVLFQLALGYRILWHDEEERTGLIAFGVAFHGAAAIVLVPAVLQSAWLLTHPLGAVHLSWFHWLHLVIGGLVFVPLRAAARAGAIRGYAAVAAVGILLLFAATPLGDGVRDAFAWASGQHAFMGFITESQPLWGSSVGGVGPLTKFLGWGIVALPFAWWAGWIRLARRRADGLLPWLVAVPPLAVLAIAQRRFADGLAGPMAVVLGWGVARLVSALEARRATGRPVVWAVLVLLPLLANPSPVRTSWARLVHGADFVETPALARQRGERALFDWLREHTREPGDPPGWSVLAQWDLGHGIEWAGARPTVGTNFGSYLGQDSYLDPWRFFLARDDDEAEAILERRGVRYVLMTSTFVRNLDTMVRLLHPEARATFVAEDGGGAWLETLGGRLLGEAPPRGREPVSWPGFLRLVHMSPRGERDPAPPGRDAPAPFGWIWERVPGAVVEVSGLSAADELVVRVDVRYVEASEELSWEGRARPGPDGVARVRVPWATDAPNGEGRVPSPARWAVGVLGGQLEIPERAVLGGERIPVTLGQ